jgi:transcriptional regulator with XRE-family HTH domain
MVSLGLNQSSLARALSTTQSTVRGWLLGAQPRARLLDELATALNCNPAWLEGHTDDPEPKNGKRSERSEKSNKRRGPEGPDVTSFSAETLQEVWAAHRVLSEHGYESSQEALMTLGSEMARRLQE